MAAVAVGLCAVTAAVTVSGSGSEYAWLEASARVLMVAAPIAVGLYARRHPPFERFGALLVAAGFGWFLTTLSGSQNDVLYSIGRLSGWLVEVVLVYVVLAFPYGRLGGIDRALVLAIGLVVAFLYLPTALLVEQYPMPSPYTTCDTDCPRNAFMLAGTEPAFVADLVRPLRELLTWAIFAAATARLGWRIEHASRLMRRSLSPVLAVAIFRLVALLIGLVARRVAADSPLTDVVSWMIALALPGIACAFLAGLVRWRLFIATAMERLALRLRAHPRPEDLRDALAEAFEDPSLEVVYWLPEPEVRWADVTGHAIERSAFEPDRCLTEVLDGDQRVAGIVHDRALQADRAFIESATSYAVMTLDNHRLSAQTASLLTEVRESRARIQAAADDERRRIEHNLHDGAQQRLVALRIKLELAAERAADDGGDPALLRGLGREVEEAIDEVRSLAHGIYPAPLAARGLVEALRSAALRAALPTTVLATGVGRYPREIETAAYFCCLEAMQNAGKHARGATATVIDVSCNGALILEIRDDGAGFDAEHLAGGVGLTSMRDRLAAVGGQLAIRSRPGRGTRVSATIPLAADGTRKPGTVAAPA